MIFVFLLLSCAIKYILTQNDAFLLLELDSNFLQVYHLNTKIWLNIEREWDEVEIWLFLVWFQPRSQGLFPI